MDSTAWAAQHLLAYTLQDSVAKEDTGDKLHALGQRISSTATGSIPCVCPASCALWESASIAKTPAAFLVCVLQESLAKEDTDDKLRALGECIDSAAAATAARQRASMAEAQGQVQRLTARMDQADAQAVSQQEAAAQAVQSQLAQLLRELQGDVAAVSQELQVQLCPYTRVH